jgi:hypothetical protein
MVVEAKLHIVGGRQLRDAYLQALSYAERLRASAIVLCAAEGVWLFERRSGRFDGERFLVRAWGELDEPLALREMEDGIGPKGRIWKAGSEA